MLEEQDLKYRALDASRGNGRRAVVIGIGASGRAACSYLVHSGWRVEAWDTRTAPAGAEAFLAAHPEVGLHCGALPERLPEDAALLVMSPGVSTRTGAAAPLVASAEAAGIPVAGEIELFAQHLAHLSRERGYAPTVIGITGTNGKTTTVTLTAKICEAAGRSVVAAGNIGPNAVTELLKAEEAGARPEIWVLELSSFQRETTRTLHCDAAALLNITADHVDWHGSIAAYAAAKARIFAADTVRVGNRDDALALEMTRRGLADESLLRTFGESVPGHPGEFGLEMAAHASQGLWLSSMDRYEIEQLYIPESAMKLCGRHNTMNALAALALVSAAGIERQPAVGVLHVYAGEPHRVELVRTVDGRDFIDDSKGTNVGAVIAAVCGLAAQGRRIRILMGGDGKGQDFTPLAGVLAGRAASVALIGRDAAAIEAALEPAGLSVARFPSLEDAVEWLWSQSGKGDVVLLSPACASWDMFRDYAERSERFKAAAARIEAREAAAAAARRNGA